MDEWVDGSSLSKLHLSTDRSVAELAGDPPFSKLDSSTEHLFVVAIVIVTVGRTHRQFLLPAFSDLIASIEEYIGKLCQVSRSGKFINNHTAPNFSPFGF